MLRKAAFFCVIFFNLLLVDQFTKAVAVASLKDRPAEAYSLPVIPGFFSLTYVENLGCAWGLFQGQAWPLAVFGIAALAVLAWKRKSILPPGRLGAATGHLLYAGITGNVIDRMTRGCVVDMFDFHWGIHHFPVFNVADSYITVAAVILVLCGLFEKKSDSRRIPKRGAEAG